MKKAMIDYMQNKKFDHFNTPDYAIKPLLPHVPKTWTIWEPTDSTGKSRITKVLQNHGCTVRSTSQKEIDFLNDKPDFSFDCIITNPPYSLKDEFIERCIELESPWALLLPLTALEGIKRGKLFNKIERFGVMIFDRRVEFTGGSCWFNTSWFCYWLLPKQLIFTELNKI